MAVVGGSVGAWLEMRLWHHKTQHKKFRYGVRAINEEVKSNCGDLLLCRIKES